MGLILYSDGTDGNFSHIGDGTELNPYFWNYYGTTFPYQFAIFMGCDTPGTIYIEYNNNTSNSTSNIYFSTDGSYEIGTLIFSNTPLIIKTTGANFGGYIVFGPGGGLVNNLKIWFVEGNVTSTTQTPATTTQQPIGSKVFIHVGDINIPDNNCGRYKLTLDGAQSSYFSIYGKRVYLTTYPENTGTYSVNVCAKDLANRFTPVCDTFDLTIKKCVFTTEPPTTTAAPNFGYVQSENAVSPVSQYTYNKIYGMKKI